ncbi:hypothetical protein FB45DRAFT_869171 [Roridomyces roridus]|uniref:Uncharacterized protein n=1 Tax=Roridomyces roridus TaxID=1738132 RepID=A0AAD7BNE2_9AGAR|nr:hypothetical protein FB45DRAFT_869171 [Roridomyces roridus]
MKKRQVSLFREDEYPSHNVRGRQLLCFISQATARSTTLLEAKRQRTRARSRATASPGLGEERREKVRYHLLPLVDKYPEEDPPDEVSGWVQRGEPVQGPQENDINPVFEDHLEGQIDGTICINDATKRAGWTHLIGGKRDTEGKLNYSALDAAVLHSDMLSTYKEAMFLKNKLPTHISEFSVADAILDGKQKANALAAGAACATSGPVMKDIHQLTHTTPGLIANAAIVTMWALSADIQLKEEGQQTGVPRREEHERLMVLLTGGLRERMRTTIEIFRALDEELSPTRKRVWGGGGQWPRQRKKTKGGRVRTRPAPRGVGWERRRRGWPGW